ADGGVVLGGGVETRTVAAADYYRKGLVKKVLIADASRRRPELLTALPSHVDLNRIALLNLGVPESAMEIFGRELANTHDEAIALREWALRTHAGAVIVPSELFGTRRERWIMRSVLDGTVTLVDVPALDEREYTANDWLKSERGLFDFHNEVLKYAYYRFKY